MSYDLSPDDVQAARERIAPYVRRTPLSPLPPLRNLMPPPLRLKLENLQVTGSFKARGAFNHMLQLTEEQRRRGVLAASGGNHGVAVAYAAARLGIPATIVLPAGASPDRAERIAVWGPRLIRHGETYSDAEKYAAEIAAREELLNVHPFNSERTLEGTGTLGLELLEDIPDLDCVVVPIGGGGLIAGVAAAVKSRRPGSRIVGVEPFGAASMSASLKAGRLVELERVTTIADTLAPRVVGNLTLELAIRYVDDVVLVSDGEMVEAMRFLWAECNQLVEPAGAAAVAALLSGRVDVRGHAHPVAIISGGNAAAEGVLATYQAKSES